ncbi:hypothetical protein ACFSTC_29200 [Nonomuraea ferruginea]
MAAAVVSALDGTRTVAQARERVRAERGVDVDVAAFVGGLADAGLMRRPERRPNVWDRIRPRQVAWFFSRPADVVLVLLTGCAVAAAVAEPRVRPGVSSLVWPGSLSFTLAFAAGSWALVLLHELGHVAAARSLGVRAELSLGTRLQFLVVQTRITGVWGVPRRARYRAHLAGMRVDWVLICGSACVLYVTESALSAAGDGDLSGAGGLAVPVLHAYGCVLRLRERDGEQEFDGGRAGVSAWAGWWGAAECAGVRVVRGCGAGAGVGVFFALYTVPITVAVVRRAMGELASGGIVGTGGRAGGDRCGLGALSGDSGPPFLGGGCEIRPDRL